VPNRRRVGTIGLWLVLAGTVLILASIAAGGWFTWRIRAMPSACDYGTSYYSVESTGCGGRTGFLRTAFATIQWLLAASVPALFIGWTLWLGAWLAGRARPRD
jgi:hypothetical protein